MDGTTDANNQEDELMVIVYCTKNREQLTVCTRYLSLGHPTRANTAGLFGEASKFMGIDFICRVSQYSSVSGIPVLMGGASDGAAVNIADHRGLKRNAALKAHSSP